MKTSVFDGELIAPLPRISVQAFCETAEAAAVIGRAFADRRMERTHAKVQTGGAAAAVETFRNAPTPNVILLETAAAHADIVNKLESLAEFCDSGTRVVVVGALNDITLYRDLMSRGVSDYLVAPLDELDVVRALSKLYTQDDADPLGRIVAVAGVKGGVGASAIAHNLAFSVARDLALQTVIADADLGFGTAGLDFNQDPPQGIAEAVFAPDRLDSNLVDRLLSRCTDKLSVLAAPATLDRVYDFADDGFDHLVDVLRGAAPCIVLDVPHLWTGWSRRMLVGADEIVLVAEPTLACLRNAKNMIDALRAARPNDAAPRLVMNAVGCPKRPEIGLADFAKAVDTRIDLTIPFDPKLFGTASNNGQMVAEVEAQSKVAAGFAELARLVTGKAEIRRPSRNILKPLMGRLAGRKAS